MIATNQIRSFLNQAKAIGSLSRFHEGLSGKIRAVFFLATATLFSFRDLSPWGDVPTELYQPIGPFAFLPAWQFGVLGMAALQWLWILFLLGSAVTSFDKQILFVKHGRLSFILCSFFSAAIGSYLLNYFNHFGKVDHDYHLLVISLWLFFLGGLRSSRAEEAEKWSGSQIALATCLVYLAAGYRKLLVSGPAWFWSDNMQLILLGGEKPFGVWLAQFPLICRSLAGGSLALEIFAPVIFFFAPLRLPFLLGWMSMHVSILLFLGPNFLAQLLNFVAWFAMPHWRTAFSFRENRGWVAVPFAILILSFYCMLAKKEFWPFSPFNMYSENLTLGDIDRFPIYLIDSDGKEFLPDMRKDFQPMGLNRLQRSFRKANQANKHRLKPFADAVIELYLRQHPDRRANPPTGIVIRNEHWFTYNLQNYQQPELVRFVYDSRTPDAHLPNSSPPSEN